MMTRQSTQPILLVEDNSDDCAATIRALRKAGVANEIIHCEDGDAALDFLHRRGAYREYADNQRPGVILLDLNMPGTDGREVLEAVNSDQRLKKIPVIVLTTSSDERDIEECYAAGANSYIQKPVDLPGYLRAIQHLKNYWFEIVLLPRQEEHQV